MGGTNLPLTIQASVNFPNFAELYLRSLTTYHFQIRQILTNNFLILRPPFQWCWWIFPNLSMSKIEKKVKRSIFNASFLQIGYANVFPLFCCKLGLASPLLYRPLIARPFLNPRMHQCLATPLQRECCTHLSSWLLVPRYWSDKSVNCIQPDTQSNEILLQWSLIALIELSFMF